jgi:hypothetical protein
MDAFLTEKKVTFSIHPRAHSTTLAHMDTNRARHDLVRWGWGSSTLFVCYFASSIKGVGFLDVLGDLK